MSKYGIKSISYQNLLDNLGLKRDILLFDKILIDRNSLEASRLITNVYFETSKNSGTDLNTLKQNFLFNQQNIEFLEAKGIIEISDIGSNFDLSVNNGDRNQAIIQNIVSNLNLFFAQYKSFIETKKTESLEKVMKGFIGLSDYSIRLFCIGKTLKGDSSFFPILQQTETYNNTNIADKNHIIKFVLNQMPEPADDVSWEQLLDFRNDIDTKAKYYALMTWINQISKDNLESSEFEERYNELYYEYLNHYRIHKIKHKGSNIEVLINGTTALIENTLKLKLSKISSNFFQIFKNEATLIESEQNILGREIAYIHKSQNQFS